jgi:hypothetical protein
MIFCLIFFIGRCSYDAHDLFRCRSATFRVGVSKKKKNRLNRENQKTINRKNLTMKKNRLEYLENFWFGSVSVSYC